MIYEFELSLPSTETANTNNCTYVNSSPFYKIKVEWLNGTILYECAN